MKLIDLIFPPKCAACDEIAYDRRDDEPFCPICAAKWELEREKCRRENQGQPVAAFDSHTFESEYVGKVLYAVNYNAGRSDHVQNSLIFKLKRTANVRVTEFCGKCMAELLCEWAPMVCRGGARHRDSVITWIPRRRETVIDLGFDHMEEVAKVLSRILDIPAVPLLKRRFISLEQKQLDASERRKNARSAIKLSKKHNAKGKIVILIDDIITTGASLHSAASLIMESGADQVISMVIAESVRDD